MRRNDLDLSLYLARLAARLNAAARRRWAHSLLNVRPFRTPEAIPVAMTTECAQPGMRPSKGRDSLESRNPSPVSFYRT